jgi:hypothetical protein
LQLRIISGLKSLNPAIQAIRVETPTLLTADAVKEHRAIGFDLCDMQAHDQLLTLRPETTWGTLKAFEVLYPEASVRKKRMPIVIWQSGKVYRNEQIRPHKEIRFREFYQIEFQLIVSDTSKADYFGTLESEAEFAIRDLCGSAYREIVPLDQLAHYSRRTSDMMVPIQQDPETKLKIKPNAIEVGAISERTDLKDQGIIVYEASFGLDRLTALSKLNQNI